MSKWGWSVEVRAAPHELWPKWLKPLSILAPWLSTGLLLAMIVMIGGVLTTAEGTLFELPEKGAGDVADTSAAALVMSTEQGTVVFFDDTRYVLSDEGQMAKFGDQLHERMNLSDTSTLLLLADRRVKGGELLELAELAKRSGARRILFAGKKTGRKDK